MADRDSREGTIREVRATLDQLHHGLRQEEAVGNANALAQVHARARDAGASDAELAAIRIGFTHIAAELVRRGATQRRRRWRPHRHLETQGSKDSATEDLSVLASTHQMLGELQQAESPLGG